LCDGAAARNVAAGGSSPAAAATGEAVTIGPSGSPLAASRPEEGEQRQTSSGFDDGHSRSAITSRTSPPINQIGCDRQNCPSSDPLDGSALAAAAGTGVTARSS